MTMIKYFVSFYHLVGFSFVPGNIEIHRDKPIRSINDLNEVKACITATTNLQNPIIISFQRFEKDTNSGISLS